MTNSSSLIEPDPSVSSNNNALSSSFTERLVPKLWKGKEEGARGGGRREGDISKKGEMLAVIVIGI